MTGTWNRKYILAALIALVTLIVYLPVLRNEFVYWDDNIYIFDNPHIRSFDGTMVRWALFHFYEANWFPLTWMSHAADYAIWGLNPLGHHLTNIILHGLNTYLVVLLVIRLCEAVQGSGFRVQGSRFTNHGSPFTIHDSRFTFIAAGVTGLLFGIHPLHVESVAWAAERKDLLCALFFLLSVMAYAKAAGRMAHGAEGNKLPLSALLSALSFFALALMSKPMAVTLPVVLLILDWYPFGRIRSFKTLWHACVGKIPFFALSLASSIITILAQSWGGSITSIEKVPLSIRIVIAAESLISYLGKMLLPLNLVPLYPYPRDASLLTAAHGAALVAVVGITAVCAVLVSRQKLWLSAWGYYVVTLIPVLGIVQVGSQAMADRYTYLPGLGPFLIAGVGAAWIAGKMKREGRRGLRTFVLGIIAVCLTLSLSFLTVQQTFVWRNSLSLWSYVIEKDPEGVPLAYNNRGMVLLKAGAFDRALEDFDKAIALNPQYAKAYYNRGLVFDSMERSDKAIADYRKTLSLDPRYFEAYYNLDQDLKKTGQTDTSGEHILPQGTPGSRRK